VVTAPAVNDFNLEGAESLKLSGYHQDKLSVTVSGYGEVHAAGETRDAALKISGAGHADLGALKAQTARIEIDGSGDATLAPTDAAVIDIAGAGEATLLTNPPKLRTHISGSGQVHQPEK
jgi:Ca2+-binding RTX toxin-like protein